MSKSNNHPIDGIAFLAYCLQVTLKNRLMIHAPGPSAAEVLKTLASIQMLDVISVF